MPPQPEAFAVKPPALSAYATTLEQLDGKVDAAKKYIEQHLEEITAWEGGAIDAVSGCWSNATSKIPEVRDAVTTNLTSLSRLTKGSAKGLEDSATTYSRLDLRHAQLIDGSYTAADVPEYNPDHKDRAEDPTAKLHDPKADEKIPAEIKDALGVLSWLSPSHLLDEGIKLVTGVNPGEWVAEKLGGNWQAFAKGGDAMRNLGDFLEAYADNIEQGQGMLAKDWHGNAAPAADVYFTNLALAVQHQGGALRSVAHEMDVAATGIAMAADGLKGLLETLSDWLIGAALTAAAAAAASETIIGGIVGGAAAAWEAYEAWSVWKQVAEKVDLAITVANTFSGFIPGVLGALHGLKDHPLPNDSYVPVGVPK
jgi:hypothetical protein